MAVASATGLLSLSSATAVELKPLEQQVVKPASKKPKPKPLPPPAQKAKTAPTPQVEPSTTNKTQSLKAQQSPKAQPPQKPTTLQLGQEKKEKPKEKPRKSGDEMLFNFQDADVKAVIKTISQITNKNFILDPRVKGKISIISAKPVSKKAAFEIFLSALKAQGFTVATVNRDTLKVIPVGEGKQNASVSRKAIRSGGEQMVSRVVVVQHGTATQMVPLLRPLMAPTSQLSAYAPANALIITDYADNIQRLLKLIGEIDQPVSTDITIIPLKHASALDMADLISRLMTQAAGVVGAAKGGGAATVGSRTSIVPDLRTNSLLVRTDNPGRVVQVQKLVEKLDVPAKTDGNTRVVYLRNAEATKLAEILRGLLEAAARKTSAAPRGAAAKGAAAATGQTSLIQADEATNSLIINASDAVYNNLRGVIEKLDVRRAQVFVEALITEISSNKASQLGFQWVAAGSAGKGGVGALSNVDSPPIGSVIADPLALASASGLTLAFLGDEVTLPDGTVTRGLAGLARALEGNSIGNILSTPNLLTLDNAEAKIVVGQNVPFLTGSFTQAATGASNPFQTIERQDVGLTLKIKPQITEGGSVKLEILSEVSDVTQSAESASDLITNKRTLETTVVVEDGHTIVLGGLIKDDITESTQGVPILSHIPILGWLFKSRTKSKDKTNLMVFLKPTIVRGPEDSYSFTADRYDYIIGQQRRKDKKGQRGELLKSFKPEPVEQIETPDDQKEETLEEIEERIVEEDLFGPPDEVITPDEAVDKQTGDEPDSF